MRRTASSNKYDTYHWYHKFSNLYPNCYYSFYVYLNTTTSTDPSALYEIDDGYGNKRLYTLNQKYAPAGWSRQDPPRQFDLMSMINVKLYTSGTSGSYTGADGIRLYITYY